MAGVDGTYGGGNISVTIIGADTAKVRLQAGRLGFENAPKALVRKAAQRMKQGLQKEAPHRSGQFAKGITYRVADEADLTVATFSAPMPLAGYIIQGTRPHPIHAFRKKALYWPGADHPVATVQHPGTKPNEFPTRAYAAAKGDIEGLLGTTGMDLLTSLMHA